MDARAVRPDQLGNDSAGDLVAALDLLSQCPEKFRGGGGGGQHLGHRVLSGDPGPGGPVVSADPRCAAALIRAPAPRPTAARCAASGQHTTAVIARPGTGHGCILAH